jgi:thiamine biosynthesis lipoprotein
VAAERAAVERRFRVMGTTAHLVVNGGGPQQIDDAMAFLEAAEARWSRFRPDSELSRCNRAAGRLTVVSAETFRLVQVAVAAWEATAGSFDPTVHDAIVALGYDDDFASVATTCRERDTTAALPAPGCADIELYPGCSAIRLPRGVALDLGGLAKGHAADLLVDRLVAAGARGACVNVGGDVRVRGQAPGGEPWVVALDPGVDGVTLPRVALMDGAVCTSSTRKRRWRHGAQEVHHLIDPRTGRSVRTGLAAVSVIGRAAAPAEVLTKAVMVGGIANGRELLESLGVAAVLVTDDGAVIEAGNVREFHA